MPTRVHVLHSVAQHTLVYKHLHLVVHSRLQHLQPQGFFPCHINSIMPQLSTRRPCQPCKTSRGSLDLRLRSLVPPVATSCSGRLQPLQDAGSCAASSQRFCQPIRTLVRRPVWARARGRMPESSNPAEEVRGAASGMCVCARPQHLGWVSACPLHCHALEQLTAS